MNDINLLPEDLRSEEEKQLSGKSGQPPADAESFHLPQNNQRPKKTVESVSLAPAPPSAPPALKKETPPSPPKLEPKRKAVEMEKRLKEKDKTFISLKEIDVNLLPEGVHLLPSSKIYAYFAWAAAVSLLIGALGFLAVVIYGQRLKGQETSLTSQLAQSEVRYNQLKSKEEELTILSQRLELVKKLISRHVYWTDFFRELEKVTVPEVYYTDIDASLDGSLTLAAVADSYLSVAKQYLAYQQAAHLIKEVSLNNLIGEPMTEAVTFNINLLFEPEIYYREPSEK